MTFDPQAIFNPPPMGGRQIQIPKDRTTKQPVYCYCRNPLCLVNSQMDRFIFQHEHGLVECPKCGATEAPYVGVLVLTHFMAVMPRGPIRGNGGIGYKITCDPTRPYLATATNEEAATDQPEVVTCPGCLAAMAAEKVDPGRDRFAIKAKVESKTPIT